MNQTPPYKCSFCNSMDKDHSCRVVLKTKIFEMKAAGDKLLIDLTEVCAMHHEDISFSVGVSAWEKINRKQ